MVEVVVLSWMEYNMAIEDKQLLYKIIDAVFGLCIMHKKLLLDMIEEEKKETAHYLISFFLKNKKKNIRILYFFIS